MTTDRDTQDKARTEGLANDSLSTSRRPAGQPEGGGGPAQPAGTPQGGGVQDEQIPKE